MLKTTTRTTEAIPRSFSYGGRQKHSKHNFWLGFFLKRERILTRELIRFGMDSIRLDGFDGRIV